MPTNLINLAEAILSNPDWKNDPDTAAEVDALTGEEIEALRSIIKEARGY